METKGVGQPGLVIACGGTGGHLFPGLAVAEAWVAAGGRVLLLVSEKKIDQEATRKYREYRFETIPALPKPPTFSPKMLPFLWSLWRTIGRCRGLLGDFRADAVLGMGGFTSLPPVVAAKRAGIPAFVHDSNALPGKANRVTARWCDRVFIGLSPAAAHFPGKPCIETGTPVRKELSSLPDRASAAAKWGLDPSRPIVLVMGGSQGARKLNALMASAPLDPGVQVLHIAGPGEEATVSGMVADSNDYRVVGFCDDMASAYAVADAVVARSGASSLTELAHAGLPSLLVPFPFAADDHQTANAQVFESAGAALLAQERDLDAEKLAALVARMLAPGTREEMARKAASLAVPDAAERVVREIQKRLGNQE
ncbi:MAG: undecaprenyldiphospho-muramoylpentapeptide beta-N-acetylglucosaminyltransferase [Akkermansiaceae bacterium]|jgi:UDP-N-acetylglucosamine--N-acetylmuramyl-(pentapeptide) pyrophosphoryl-undecaprenol N-acetylglucosamine transferase|nr:undecaprenyldiphospho-muramoylpentapeptide beta-N-acetylglucosaminyltransferase [Akkermansiaceae bacterium]